MGAVSRGGSGEEGGEWGGGGGGEWGGGEGVGRRGGEWGGGGESGRGRKGEKVCEV